MNAKELYHITKIDYKSLCSSQHKINHMGGGKEIITEMCEFESIGPEPSEDSVIISCSIFKLNDMYRDITVYLEGLKRLIDFVNDIENTTKLHLIIYYDHSVESDEKWIDLKTYILYPHGLSSVEKNKRIQINKYKCLSFIKDNLHRGTFGTFIRFYPLFNKKYEKNLKFVSDIDYSDREILFYCKYVVDKMLKYLHNCMCIYKIGYEWKYANFLKMNIWRTCSCKSLIQYQIVFRTDRMLEDISAKIKKR